MGLHNGWHGLLTRKTHHPNRSMRPLMSTPANRDILSSTELGTLGEEFVAQWVQKQGWLVLHRRWRCRFGELDLVLVRHSAAGEVEAITFVEVKTRRRRSWDEDGKLAVNFQKQAKLWKTAQLFLMQHPEFAELPCCFDVAIVTYRKLPHSETALNPSDAATLTLNGYQLTLLEYIPAAFS